MVVATVSAARRTPTGAPTMDLFLHLLGQYGLPIVFLAVLLEQGGLPLPAYPIIIAASSLAVSSS